MKIVYGQPNGIRLDERIPAQNGKTFGILGVQRECRGELNVEIECGRNLVRYVVAWGIDHFLEHQDVRFPQIRLVPDRLYKFVVAFYGDIQRRDTYLRLSGAA